MDELVVNWHITEACNYNCRYCFAKWEGNERELIHNPLNIGILIREIPKLLEILNENFGTCFKYIRLNLVGGEPLLYPEAIREIIHCARQSGLLLSLITNGSLLNQDWVNIISESFVQIGFSVDSIHEQTNVAIGRGSNREVFKASMILQYINAIRTYAPNIGIKINTVVNEYNFQEDMNDFIHKANPQKWKIFKMLPIITNNLSVSNQQFETFLLNHQAFRSIISSENNDEMTQSYLMIDPEGRFFQNHHHGVKVYQYSHPIHKVGIQNAFNEITFHVDKFHHRYIPLNPMR
ncbi:viperin family antiviral radical SAM protein [Conchiformibius kuhniae]|uniref:S-adenosylmethionine-dependent nucleotide dehydratase n=1 Tax=Conchiformibius kuhniae TaxID=211502 RepID=A0A8T9MZ51_9NEIS|nr:viperin family antiviral radical SAM protein [Conchiformibius kuhniae]UOP05472.1 viperin family antiviral radical SAM protein [Conchiformibius kuhniae]